MHQELDYIIGERRSRNPYSDKMVDFGFTGGERRQHVYVVGKTGQGKSTLLGNLAVQDITQGEGVTVIDPHGSLVEALLDRIPPWRADDLAYLNPADLSWPIGFNICETPTNRDHIPRLASDVVAAFKGVFGDSWGPRLEFILYNAVAALIEVPNTSLLGVTKMLTSASYRRWVGKQVHDPVVRSFWITTFESWDTRQRAEAVSPVINKVDQVLGSPYVRNILGQVASTIDLRFMMDTRRVLLVNLSKGMIGEDKANLFGSLLAAKLHTDAMSRADVSETERVAHFCFFDEFHSFTTHRFANSLSEARKYCLFLVLANQYISQMMPDIRHAVFGNVDVTIAFRVGASCADILAPEFGEEFRERPWRFTDIRSGAINMRHGSDDPILGYTFPLSEKTYGKGDKLIARSREKYGRKRSVVEDKINRFMERWK